MAGKRSVLIVASDTYGDPKLARLRSPSADTAALARVLGDPSIGNFIVNSSLNETEAVIRRKLSNFFTSADREDLLVLHVACHGVKDDDGNLYFATADTETTDLLATAVPADFVERLMGRSPSRRIVLLLDCCYSGAFARGMRARGDSDVHVLERFTGRGRAVLTASSAMEYAWEGDDVSGEGLPSVFTSAVVRGLETGDADRDGDGDISVDELYDYVLDRVRETTPQQTPNKQIQMQGDLVIAKSIRGPRSTTTKLPAELLGAVRSPLVGVREGAVSELARLLRGGEPALAREAAAMLGEFVDDDSRRVSTIAAQALSDIGQAKQRTLQQISTQQEALAQQPSASIPSEQPTAPPPAITSTPAWLRPTARRIAVRVLGVVLLATAVGGAAGGTLVLHFWLPTGRLPAFLVPKSDNCTYELGFRMVAEAEQNLVGACVSNVVYDYFGGVQYTKKGLLFWHRESNTVYFFTGQSLFVYVQDKIQLLYGSGG